MQKRVIEKQTEKFPKRKIDNKGYISENDSLSRCRQNF